MFGTFIHVASESDLILESLLLAAVSGVRLVEFEELKHEITLNLDN